MLYEQALSDCSQVNNVTQQVCLTPKYVEYVHDPRNIFCLKVYRERVKNHYYIQKLVTCLTYCLGSERREVESWKQHFAAHRNSHCRQLLRHWILLCPWHLLRCRQGVVMTRSIQTNCTVDASCRQLRHMDESVHEQQTRNEDLCDSRHRTKTCTMADME